MNTSLGNFLKTYRKSLHLTQKEAAQDICAQSMLSAIENNKYIPNAQLLIKLCQRYNLSLDELSLAQNYDISAAKTINKQMEQFCNQHQYQVLLDFLQTQATIAAVQTATQTQAYYYYLGVAQYQVQTNTTLAVQSFKLSLAQAPKQINSTLTRLTKSSLGLIYANQHQPYITQSLVQQSLAGLSGLKYEDNQNILYYLAAAGSYQLKQYVQAITYLTQGIRFAADHNSHYLLANDYYLLAHVAKATGNDQQQRESLAHQQFLSELFNEKIYRNL